MIDYRPRDMLNAMLECAKTNDLGQGDTLYVNKKTHIVIMDDIHDYIASPRGPIYLLVDDLLEDYCYTYRVKEK